MKFIAVFLLLVVLAGCCSAGSCPISYNSMYEQVDTLNERDDSL